MNCLKRLSFALAVCLAASVPMWGQSAQVVYVATGDSNVYAVSTDGTGTVTALIPSTVSTYAGDAFSSLAVGPDNTNDNSGNTDFFLYACDSTNGVIIRLTLSASSPDTATAPVDLVSSAMSAPVCGRVDSNGDLYVSSANTGSGVYVFNGVSTGGTSLTPTEVYNIGGSFSGGGIAQKNTGDLLVVDNHDGTVLHAGFVGAKGATATPPFGPLDTSDPIVTGLSSPTGIARIGTGDFFVVNEGASEVRKYNPADTSIFTTCGSFSNPDLPPTSIAASEDNFLYIGVANNSPNKGSIQILNGTTCQQAASTIQIGANPLAVAVPPVEAAPVASSHHFDPSSGVTSSTFNFGTSVVDLSTQGTCEPVVTQSQVPLSYLQPLIDGASSPTNSTTWNGGTPAPYNAEGGFATAYTVTGGCSATQTDNDFIVGAFDDATLYPNPRIVRCDAGTGCEVIDASGSWPVGGLLPDDITIGGKVPGFSQFFLVNGTMSASDTETGTFCGFASPLTNTSSGDQPAVFKSGKNLSVKFKLAQTTGSCQNGPYITDAIALLSVAQVPDMSGTGILTPVTITSSGNSSPEPIFSYTPNNQQYQFSLSLKGFTSGTYALIVTFLSNTTVGGGASYVVTYFKVP